MGIEFPHDFETWVRWLTFVPLLAASLVGCTLSILKWLDLRRPMRLSEEARSRLWDLIGDGRLDEARDLIDGQPVTRASRLVVALLGQASRSTDLLKDRAEQIGGQLVREMEAGLGGLSLVATLGPLFGLWGTVVGIVMVFNRLSLASGVDSPQALAGGIGTALYTTIVGIAIGVMALIVHRYLSARVERLTAELEAIGLDVVERLTTSSR